MTGELGDSAGCRVPSTSGSGLTLHSTMTLRSVFAVEDSVVDIGPKLFHDIENPV